MAILKTRRMQLIEIQHGRPIEQILFERYVLEGQSLATIGAELGVDPSNVFRFLRRCGIPTRPRNAMHNKQELTKPARLRKGGLSSEGDSNHEFNRQGHPGGPQAEAVDAATTSHGHPGR